MIDIKDYKTEDGKLDEVKIKQLVDSKPLLESVSEEKFRDFSVKLNRDVYVTFPDRLPTTNKLPFPIDEHEHIGMYENNHTLYLTIANAYNKAMERIEELEQRVTNLEGS